MARVTAWLFVESEILSAQEMSELIGIPCDHSWHKGDSRNNRKKYHTSSWQLGSETVVGESSEDIFNHIKAALLDIINRMKGHEVRFRSVAEKNISGLLIGITSEAVPAIIIDAASIQGLNVLGVDLEIDLILTG
jgi:hypothetical protein